MHPENYPHAPRNEDMDCLLSDLAAVAEHHNPHRDGVLLLALEADAEFHGPGVTFSLERLNKLLAAYKQPLATMAEINVWYGDPVAARALN